MFCTTAVEMTRLFFLHKGINFCDFYHKKLESFCDFYPETLKSLYGRLGVSVLHIQKSASMV